MKILAFEFSSLRRSVAVLDTNTTTAGAGRGFAEESGGRSTHAFQMVAEALRQAVLEREAIECLVVGIGPGSYNGVRLAIALAQGWQLARGTRILGISTVECLVTQAWQSGLRSQVNIAIDAQRDGFCVAGYDLAGESPRIIEPLRLAPLAEVQSRIDAGGLVIGPEVTRWFPSGRVIVPSAAILAQLATGRRDFIPGEKLEPIYLRETAFVKAPPARMIPTV